MSRRAIVIGGGVSGLASAALLAHDGWDVDLVEQADRLGGRAAVWEDDGFVFDAGPSWLLMPEVFDHFFRLLGTSLHDQLDLIRLDPGYRVFFEHYDDYVEIHADRARNVALFGSIENGADVALERYLESAEEAYQLAVRRFLYSTFERTTSVLTPDVIRRVPRLAVLLTRSLGRHVAARFTDQRLRQILGYPAVFLGTSPDRAPSLYHLMSWMDLADGVYYPQGGFGALIDAVARLARDAGVRIHTSTEVTTLRIDRSGRRPRVTGAEVASGDRTTVLTADVVVAATDLHHVETELLPRDLQTYPETWWGRRDPGPGAVLVHLGVRGELPQLAHHSLFFTADWDRNFRAIFSAPTQVPEPASAYVCRPSATDPSVAPDGAENVFVLVPVPADPAIGRGGRDGTGDPMVEKVADAVIDQIATWAGIPDLADRIVLRRTVGPRDFAAGLHAWRGGALGPGHTLTQSAFLRAGNASRRVDGLLYAGSSTIPGIGLPMCLISAELVLKRLRGDRSTGPLREPLAAGVHR
ncbi:phytoene desaturase [Aeromicrobium camelliae]|uniref:Phytoene desaturase n=1 Tax=Aeromicrobium camelliae TaxID=1538144 RepID=A0A3N6W4M1_9ACTN|nr:phytoene desaturase family protein [Aeromicrobium camelliae]RQN02486.1 phytoene desaturase [Aeromicrobium camelliae]